MAATYDEIVFFGDSLTDTGRGAALFGAVLTTTVPPPAAGYAGGAYTNGPVFADVLPGLLGVPDGASSNLAVGGARAAGPFTIGELIAFSDPDGNGIASLVDPAAGAAGFAADISLSGQIADYGAAGEGTTLASVFIGSNDLLGILAEITADGVVDPLELLQLPGRVAAVVDAIADGLASLSAAGVDEIALFPFPDLSVAPLAADLPEDDVAALAGLVASLNVALATVAGSGPAAPSTTLVDLGTVSEEVAADLGTFGILETGPQVLGDGLRADAVAGELAFTTSGVLDTVAADQIAFFDLLHPAVAVHGVIAAHTARQLSSDYAAGDGTGEAIAGTAADDFVYGRGGNDAIDGGNGDNALFGGLGDDVLSGGVHFDLLVGGDGDDMADGSGRGDVLAGGAGDDTLEGGAGFDVLIDGLGSDDVIGGRGKDTFIWKEASLLGGADGDIDRFAGAGGADRLILVVSAETAADAAFEAEVAALEAAIAAPGSLRGFAFETIGLELRNVEEVTVLGPDHAWTRADFIGAAAVRDLALEADLWGLV